MELSDLLVETSEVKATYKGHDFTMQVFTEKLTPEYKAQIVALNVAAAATADDNVSNELKDETATMLSGLIQSWDVVLHGDPYEPSYENFLKLSYALQAALLRRITEFLGDLANPPKETDSPNSLAQAAKPE